MAEQATVDGHEPVQVEQANQIAQPVASQDIRDLLTQSLVTTFG